MPAQLTAGRASRIGQSALGALLLGAGLWTFWGAASRQPSLSVLRAAIALPGDDPHQRVVTAAPVVFLVGLAAAVSLVRRHMKQPSNAWPARSAWWAGAAWTLMALSVFPAAFMRPFMHTVMIGSLGLGLLLAGFILMWARGGWFRQRGMICQAAMSRPLAGVIACPSWLFAGVLWIIALLAMAALSSTVFHRTPLLADTACQLQQARVMAQGKLMGDPQHPPVPIQTTCLIQSPRGWYSKYPPGHIVLLAVGVLLGAPWLVNPVLGATALTLVYAVGRELYDETTARLAAGLGLASPFVLFMSSEFMNHATAWCGFMIFLWGFARMLNTGRLMPALAAGAGLGLAAVTRPLTALGLAVPFIAVSLWKLRQDARRYAVPLVSLAAIVMASLALFGCYNLITSGSPWRCGYEVLHGAGTLPGFHGCGDGGMCHTLGRGIANAWNSLVAMNLFAFGWPYPPLVVALAVFWVRRSVFWDGVLACSWIGLWIAYVFHWSNDFNFGPRFLYEGIGLVVLLMARGLQELMRGIDLPHRALSGWLAAAMILVGVIGAGLGYVPRLAGWYAQRAAVLRS